MIRFIHLLAGALLTVILLTPAPAQACMHAFHHQLAPLGYANEEVIAVELVASRTSDIDMTRTWWTGTLRLVSITTDHPQQTNQLSPPISFNTRLLGYRATVTPLVALLLLGTATRQAFTPFTRSTIRKCNDRLQCEDWSLKFSPHWALTHPVASIPVTTILPPPLLTHLAHSAGTKDPADTRSHILENQLEAARELPTAGEEEFGYRFLSFYLISAVHTFTNPQATVHIISLRRGDSGTNTDPSVPSTSAPQANPPLIAGLHEPTVHHHGEGFDLLIRTVFYPRPAANQRPTDGRGASAPR
jgi:hypothetical protein